MKSSTLANSDCGTQTTKPIRRHPRLEWERKAGQPVYSPAFGFGEIVAIHRGKITVKFGKKERIVGAQDFTTRAQAEINWHSYWHRGERRRLEEGKRLSIVKNLCRFGEWQAFLDKYDYPRSTADDLIRRYNDELRWEAKTQQLTGNRASDGDVVHTERHINDRVPDSDADEREDLVRQETDRRRGKKPSEHKEWWSIRIALPPDILARCRKRYKRKGKASKRWWRFAAYIFIGVTPPELEETRVPSTGEST